MDLFPANTGRGTKGGAGAFGTKGQVMGYYDGNTVTALWNYAQHSRMNDNSFSTNFGPSTPGAHQPGLRPDQRHDPAARLCAGKGRHL